MVFQPASAHLPTRVISTGATTSAVVSQNFLRASTRSKNSLTQIDSLRAAYPIKLLSPASANTASNHHQQQQQEQQEQPKKPIPTPPRIVYMITYGGGLLADDHPDLQLVISRYAKLLILGQGNTKIYKAPKPDHPPASQTLHSTVGPGALFLFLGPPVVACEDSNVFLRHEIVLQAQRRSYGRLSADGKTVLEDEEDEEDEEEELPSCVALDWITGGRGEEERWKARRSEWRLIVRWAELESEGFIPFSPSEPISSHETQKLEHQQQQQQQEEEEEEEFVDEEDPRDIADRKAGGPVIFRDGFLIEHSPTMPQVRRATATPTTVPSPSKSPTGTRSAVYSSPLVTSSNVGANTTASPSSSSAHPPRPKAPLMTSYAPSLYPHSTIGSLFIMGPKTARLQRAILRRFEHMTIYPGQKAEQRADYPILWSVTVVQVPRPHRPNQRNPTIYDSDPRLSPTRKRGPRKSGGAQGGSNSRTKFMMDAMVVKMASQGVEQMQNFLKSLFEEQDAEHDNRINMMDNEEQKERHRREKTEVVHQEEGPSVVEELFGGRVVWERAFR